MDKYQNKYRTQSIRANWHRYDGGVYFVTICTHNRKHYFGEITHDRTDVVTHCRDVARNVSAMMEMQTAITDEKRNINTQMAGISPRKNTLAAVIRGIKSSVSKFANQNDIPFAWQTRFYDRIVRNNDELNRIANYIEKNIANWQTDEINKTT